MPQASRFESGLCCLRGDRFSQRKDVVPHENEVITTTKGYVKGVHIDVFYRCFLFFVGYDEVQQSS